MPSNSLSIPAKAGGIHVGNVGESVNFNALGDIVGGDKISHFTTTIQISVEAVTQRPLNIASPYRGLERFEDRDKDLFFGRDQLIKSLLTQLGVSNVLMVLGASGSGKSSAVRAGLLPQLTQLIGARFRYFTFVPDVNPFESLRGALLGGGFSQAQTRELTGADPATPARLIRTLRRDGEQWLFFVDQFEEIFTVCDEAKRQAFIAALLAIAQDADNPVKLVLAMRADFLDRFSPFPEFAKIIEKDISLVADMHADELRQAIEQPAARHGMVFEQGLVEEIIKDVQGQAGSLPLLQYTLDLLWQEEARIGGLDDRHLNTNAYRELGGVRGALQKRANEIYAVFGDGTDAKAASPQQEVVRHIFLRLVDLAGEGSNAAAWRPVRRRAPMAMFATEQEILDALINQKLLVSSREGDDATAEVAHEALFTSWERLRNWIEAGKQVIFARNRLADDARRWQHRVEDGDAGAEEELLAGSRLSQALDMRARGDFTTVVGGLGEIETQFLEASAAMRDQRVEEERARQQRELEDAQKLAESAQKLAQAERARAEVQVRAARRQRTFLYGMAGLLVAMALVAVIAWRQRINALVARKVAEHQKAKATRIASDANVALARLSKETGKRPEALVDLAQALRLNPANHEAVWFITGLLLEKSFHYPIRIISQQDDSRARSAQFSPDGNRVVIVARSLSAVVWDVATGQSVGAPMTHDDDIVSAAFSPDSQRIVTTSKDQTARVWDGSTGRQIGEPMKHEDVVHSARFSPDGQRIVTTSKDQTARVWDANTGKPISEPMVHPGSVRFAYFSPDGRLVVTGANSAIVERSSVRDNAARIWDATSGKLIGEPLKHGSDVLFAQFSPDGKRLVTASGDNTSQDRAAHLWDVATGKAIGEPMVHADWVMSAQFSPDGQRVVTASRDKTACVWDATTCQPIGELMNHRREVIRAEFSPDGQQVATASGDGTARLWDAATGQPIGEPMRHGAGVARAQFSSDGRRLLTTARDNTARVWEVAARKSINEKLNLGFVTYARFGPDGQRIVINNRDKTAQVWDLGTSQPIGAPLRHRGVIHSTQFSPDGRRVVTASHDKTARLWDAATGQAIGEPMKHEGPVHSAQFDASGQRVLTASDDQTARVWDATTGKAVSEPLNHSGEVSSAQFSPDGRWVVTASRDKTVRVWDAATSKPVCEPMQHDNWVMSAQFSPDGRRVATACQDHAVRLWDPSTGKVIGSPMLDEGVLKGVQFSPDGRRLLTVSWEKTARLWDAATGQPIGEPMLHWDWVFAAHFSPDGERVITCSKDETARLWSATTAQPIGEPMLHDDWVHSAQFRPDGQRVVTCCRDGNVRLWDVPAPTDKDTVEIILQLCDLAETFGGAASHAPTAQGPGKAEPQPGTPATGTPLQRFMQWMVADPVRRTISPFSQIPVQEWIERQIKIGDIAGLREAMQVNPGDPRLAAHLGRKLADRSLTKRLDPAEARRARGDADFLTARAHKLAPESKEIENLRAETATLLQLKSN